MININDIFNVILFHYPDRLGNDGRVNKKKFAFAASLLRVRFRSPANGTLHFVFQYNLGKAPPCSGVVSTAVPLASYLLSSSGTNHRKYQQSTSVGWYSLYINTLTAASTAL